MKITDIRTLCLSRPHEKERQWATAGVVVPKADCAIVIIDTDEGLQGLGEPSAYGTPPAIRQRVDELKADLIGKDPAELSLPWPEAGARTDAVPLAGIDCALWDLRGKIAGKRSRELLTGPDQVPLDRVRLYASAGVDYDWENRPESVVDEATRLAERGFTAFKMRIGTEWTWAGVTAERLVELLRKVTDAVGQRLDLMLDGNCRLDEEQALHIGKALDEMGWYWFEEPIPGAQIEGYARLNEALDIPVTGGESMHCQEQVEPYLEQKAYAIVQADAGVCGVSEGRRIGLRAHEFGVPHCPHNWHNGLMTMANAALVAAHPAPRVLELNMVQGPLQWEILAEPPHIEDGHLILPDKPGYGVELAADLEERFPYIDGPWAERVER
ncbi:mandelate racemase/muconate lactonizing enzyme family protein [Candidatus Latescibacterota bacterium]